MDRFLRYSLEKGRPIRAMLTLEGKLSQRTVSVLALDERTATLRMGRRETTVPLEAILSCDYARGDHGEE